MVSKRVVVLLGLTLAIWVGIVFYAGVEEMYLFSVDLDFKEDLQSGTISDELRDMFRAEDYPLSDKAVLHSIGEDKWEIIDKDKKYMFKVQYNEQKKHNELNIYGGIIDFLKKVDPIWLPMVTSAYVIGITGYAAGWIVILHMQGLRLANRDVFKIVYSSVFFNEVTPTAAYGGEVARVYFAVKKFGLDAGTVISGCVAHRAIASVKNGIITLPMGLYLVFVWGVPWPILIGLIIALAVNIGGWGILFFLGWNVKRAERIVEKLIGLISRIKKVGPETKASIMETVGTYNKGLRVLTKRPDLLLLLLVMMAFVWGAYGTLATYSFKAMGVVVDMEDIFLIFTMYAIIRMIPTALPEFVSSKEAILYMFFSMSGYDKGLSLAVIALMRTSNLLAFIIIGGITTLMLGFKKSDLAEMAKVETGGSGH